MWKPIDVQWVPLAVTFIKNNDVTFIKNNDVPRSRKSQPQCL